MLYIAQVGFSAEPEMDVKKRAAFASLENAETWVFQMLNQKTGFDEGSVIMGGKKLMSVVDQTATAKTW